MTPNDTRTVEQFEAEMLELRLVRLIETNRNVSEDRAKRIVALIPIEQHATLHAAERIIRDAAIEEFMQTQTWRDYSKL